MLFPNDTETTDITDRTTDRQLLLDGTVHIDDPEDETIPRVKGMVELISDYLRH